eukprot:21371-Heterococcus_DN1.PRE.2
MKEASEDPEQQGISAGTCTHSYSSAALHYTTVPHTRAAAAGGGHVVSLAVSEGYRRRGVARHLMLKLQDRMHSCHGAATCSLHVRRSNQEAVALYRDVLGYGVVTVAEHKEVRTAARAAWFHTSKTNTTTHKHCDTTRQVSQACTVVQNSPTAAISYSINTV